VADRFQLRNAERPALVPRLRAWSGDRFNDRFARGFIYGSGIVVPIKENEQHGVELLRYVYSTNPLARLAVFKHTSTFDLQLELLPVANFDSVVSRLSGRRKRESKNASCFILSHFAGDAKRLPCEGAIFSGQLLCLSQDVEDCCGRHRLANLGVKFLNA